jgi:hypothetical protein
VGQASQQYQETYRRYNYTTPKSYLELISLYKTLLARKRADLQAAKERLQNGVEKIAQASAQVCLLSVSECIGETLVPVSCPDPGRDSFPPSREHAVPWACASQDCECWRPTCICWLAG